MGGGKKGWVSCLGFSLIRVCLRQDISGMSESKRGSEKIRTNARFVSLLRGGLRRDAGFQPLTDNGQG